MINIQTGIIDFKNSFYIKPKMSFLMLNKLTEYLDKDHDDMNNGWEWLRLKNIKTESLSFYISCGFKEKILETVTLRINNDQEEWNTQSEMKLKEKHRLWLNREIGQGRNFSWGEIESTFDQKSCSSNIVINYN